MRPRLARGLVCDGCWKFFRDFLMNVNPSQPSPNQPSQGERVAMLLQGDEVYGIGTILKLYALGLPKLNFIALGEGPMVEWLAANGNRLDVVPGLVRFEEGGASLSTV